MSSDGQVAISVPIDVYWNDEVGFRDWFLEFPKGLAPRGAANGGLWIDAPKGEGLYPGQLLIIRKTDVPVRGTVPHESHKYWEIVK